MAPTVPAAKRVPGQSLEQGFGNFARYGKARHHGGEGAVGGGIDRVAAIDAIQPVLQPQHRGGAIMAEIDGVIGEPAEGVQRNRRIGGMPRQHLGGGVEGARTAFQQRAAGRHVGPFCR